VVAVYAALCVLGTAFPLYFLGSFVADEGLDPPAFFDQMTATDISLFAWADVAVSALAVIAFAVHRRAKGLATWWLAVVATLTIGVSLGLPLLLLLRERAARAVSG
jgi:Terpene cyclase DEP1